MTDGLAERVGTPEAVLRIRRSSGDIVTERLARQLPAIIAGSSGPTRGRAGSGRKRSGSPDRRGHRVVHGGERFTRSVLWTTSGRGDRLGQPPGALHNPATWPESRRSAPSGPTCPQVR